MECQRLDRSWFAQPTQRLAAELLGKTLVRQLDTGETLQSIIVEVEAYLDRGDPASHSWPGMKNKNRSMFSKPGTLYVYPIHSRHCLNVVTEPESIGAAVLIRSLEPLNALDSMWAARFQTPPPAGWRWSDLYNLTRGPGRLCESLSVDRELDGVDLCTSNQIWISEAWPQVAAHRWKKRRSPRINVSAAKTRQLRWFIDGNRFVSGRTRDHSEGRQWAFQNLLSHRLTTTSAHPT